MEKQRNLLVTVALYYANGPIHLGHLVEAIQADIWVRWQRLQQNHCLFISGSDAHGTSIMISAEQKGITPEALITHMNQQHLDHFKQFLIDFDYFYTTHSPENQTLTNTLYKRLEDKGDIKTRTISQAFDPERNIFLADRFIRGECPKCHAVDQYGDNCENCGATYEPFELKNPISTLTGATPTVKDSLHYFFRLEHYHEFLNTWLKAGRLSEAVTNKMREWLDAPLKDWDISRDAPYFGFKIPNTVDKYFYVWLEAPIGYMACLKKLSEQHPDIHFDDYWEPNTKTELYHFIGKDIVYFHALFWPAMLQAAQFRLPTSIFVHGFLTINGQKMSKSRGTFITAEQYLKTLDPEFLRYYFAAKLTDHIEDIDLNFEDFCARINSDLVGKFINIASRCAGFIHTLAQGKLSNELPDPALFDRFIKARQNIADAYETRQYNRAIRDIMALADLANQYINQQKPWQLAKSDNPDKALFVCTQGLNLFKILATYLQPVLPNTTEKIAHFLKIDALTLEDLDKPLLNHNIAPFKPLIQRVKLEDIDL